MMIEKIKKFVNPSIYIICLYIICLAVIGAIAGYNRIFVSDYFPINGDWQNYNPVRRVLSGYVPYVDFPPYIGLCIVALTIPFCAISNTFTTSLFATNFSVIICFILFSLTVLYLTTKHLRFSMLGSLVLPMILTALNGIQIIKTIPRSLLKTEALTMIINMLYKTSLFSYISFYDELILPGNSYRMGRAFLPVFLILICLLFIKYKRIEIIEIVENKKTVCIVAFISGFSVLWSNDFGFSSVASAGLTLFLTLLYKKIRIQKIMLQCLIFIVTALLGFIFCATIITLGKPLAVIETLSGIADYQFWYFAVIKDTTIVGLILAQLPFIFPVPFCYVVLAIKAFKKHITTNDILLFYLITTYLAASFLYMFGSGHSFNTVLLYISLLAIVGWFINLINVIINKNIKHNKKIMVVSQCFFTACMLIYLTINCISLSRVVINYRQPKDLAYIDELGGYTQFGDSLSLAKQYIADEKIFSTYANAIEVMTGQFQPSGVDYIIHVLGDKQRKNYIQTFKNGDYKFVQTIRPDTTNNWEKWIQPANWFFYREFMTNYTPAMLTDYSIIWEKNRNPTELLSASVNIEFNNNISSSQINITLDESIDCIADIEIEYDTKRIKNGIHYKNYIIATDLNIWEVFPNDKDSPGFNSWGLPIGINRIYNIPIIIKNGSGEVRLTAPFRQEGLVIDINKVTFIKLLPMPDYENIPDSADLVIN